MRALLFGGTTEGRELAEWIASRPGNHVVAYSATEYGGSLVEGRPSLESRVERLSFEQMRDEMASGGYDCAIDATHPYADRVTSNIARAASEAGISLMRVLRDAEPEGPWEGAANAAEAARICAGLEGNILLTTGSKELSAYVEAIPDAAERIYARVLPVEDSIAAARGLGIPVSHIIAMQGPFSEELNCALIHEFDIEILVTKASGATGGFQEKVDAALRCGCKLVVIRRPFDERGFSPERVREELAERHGA